MYDLSLSTEQAEIRETLRDFVRNEIAPVVLHPDYLEDLSCPLPLALVEKASRLGLRTLALPEEHGGAGADTLTCCIAMEELGAGDAGIAATLAHTAVLGRALFGGALGDAQMQRVLPQFQSDDSFQLAYVADADAPDLDLVYHRNQTSSDSGAVRAAPQQNGDWVLNGASRYAGNVPLAKLVIIEIASAKADAQPPRALLVVPEMHGVRVETREMLVHDARGAPARRWTHGASGRLVFTECRVPAANVIALTFDLARAGRAAWASPLFPAINLGIGRSALAAAVEYAKLRVQGGRRIVEHQAIGEILADCAIHLETARNMVWKAAWACDHPDTASADGLSAAALQHAAKVFTSEAVHKLSLEAAECFGAMGIMLDMPMTRYVRDARIFLHSGRSNTAARFRIAEELAGYTATRMDL